MSEQQWLMTSAQLDNTPSRRDGITSSLEKQIREKTVFFIESLCAVVKCNMLVKSSACVYFHRFYIFHSFKTHERLIIAVACLFLACKVEEEQKRIKEIMVSYFDVCKLLNPSMETPTDDEKTAILDRVIISERIVLQTLGFDLQITHPVVPLYTKWNMGIKKYVAKDKLDSFIKTARKFMQDCYRSTIPIQYSSKDIAMSVLFLATLDYGDKPVVYGAHSSSSSNSNDTQWIDLFEYDITEEKLNGNLSLSLSTVFFYIYFFGM